MITQHTCLNISGEFQMGWGNLVKGEYVVPKQFYDDLNYFWDIGIRKVRIAMQGGPPFYQKTINLQNRAAILAKEKGFHVSYGLCPPFAARHNIWGQLREAQLQHALLMKDYVDVYVIGNENDAYYNLGVSPITVYRSGNQVYCSTTYKHYLETGDSIAMHSNPKAPGELGGPKILGTIDPNTYVSSITVLDEYNFRFSNAGENMGPETAYFGNTVGNVHRMMKRQAAFLKQNGFNKQISFSCAQGYVSETKSFAAHFAEKGIGDMDFIDLNCYGWSQNKKTSLEQFYTAVKSAYDAVPKGKLRITELNVDRGSPASTGEEDIYLMMERVRICEKFGIDYYIFTSRQHTQAEYGYYGMIRPFDSDVNLKYKDKWAFIASNKQRTRTKEFTINNFTNIIKLRNRPLTRKSNLININYGQNVQGGPGTYDAAQVTNDLKMLRKAGIERIRIALSSTSWIPSITATQNVAKEAKSLGFYVVWGITEGFGKSKDETWQTYCDNVVNYANWAQQNGIDEYQIGNELEYSETVTRTLTNAVDKIKALATRVKQESSFTRTISYSVAQSSCEPQWVVKGKGDIDLIAYNVYGDYASYEDFCFKINRMYNAFGNTNMYIAEWNISGYVPEITQYPMDVQVALIQQRREFIENLGLTHFFFTVRGSGTHQPSLYNPDGSIKKWKNALFSYTHERINAARTRVTNRPKVPCVPGKRLPNA